MSRIPKSRLKSKEPCVKTWFAVVGVEKLN